MKVNFAFNATELLNKAAGQSLVANNNQDSYSYDRSATFLKTFEESHSVIFVGLDIEDWDIVESILDREPPQIGGPGAQEVRDAAEIQRLQDLEDAVRNLLRM